MRLWAGASHPVLCVLGSFFLRGSFSCLPIPCFAAMDTSVWLILVDMEYGIHLVFFLCSFSFSLSFSHRSSPLEVLGLFFFFLSEKMSLLPPSDCTASNRGGKEDGTGEAVQRYFCRLFSVSLFFFVPVVAWPFPGKEGKGAWGGGFLLVWSGPAASKRCSFWILCAGPRRMSRYRS